MSLLNLYSWNVNGVRAVFRKGFFDWFEEVNGDAICLQEIKFDPERAKPNEREALLPLLEPKGYFVYWHPAKRPGYSGVATFSKREPLSVQKMGIEEFDDEGRVLALEYSDYYLVNAYFPNSGREHERLPYKLKFDQAIHEFCNGLVSKGKGVVLCGDYNVAHEEIDLKNPKSNHKTAGFLPEERKWMNHFLDSGYVDTFRSKVEEPGHYSWWSYRPGVRQKNIGWRIDYHCVNQGIADRIGSVGIQPQVMGSDHCPVVLGLKR